MIRPSFYFLFYRFLSQQVRVGGRNENKIKSDLFPIELKLKETRNQTAIVSEKSSVFTMWKA